MDPGQRCGVGGERVLKGKAEFVITSDQADQPSAPDEGSRAAPSDQFVMGITGAQRPRYAYIRTLIGPCAADEARRFWEEKLDIKIDYVWVSASTASKRIRNTLPNGTLNIRVGRCSLEWYTKMMVWLELAQDLPFTAATRFESPRGQ
jgi:hypothetical protein